MQLTTGQYRVAGQVFGSYRCLALLGEGGMGHVYLAEHIRLGRKVALKRLKDRVASQPDAVEQFVTEAKAVNRIHHPHIVDITDFCNDSSGVYYLMELLEGQTLAEHLREQGPMPERRVLYIGHQVADALSAAHRADVLHLDIKPSNIFLIERDGRPDFSKLLDFGLARLRGVAETEKGDEADADIGPVTPAFMAPEQATTATLDHRADVYSLGAVLYAMLAGRPPFEAHSVAEFVHKHLHVNPKPLSSLKGLPEPVSPECSRLVMRCLNKRAEDRPQSAAELRDLLGRVSEVACGIRLAPGQPPEAAPRRLPWRWIGGGAALALLIVGLVIGVSGWLSDRAARRTGPVDTRGTSMGTPQPSQLTGSVLLTVTSDPDGAEVYRVGDNSRLLGLTPLKLGGLPAGQTLTLRLARGGSLPKTLQVALGSGTQRVHVELDARPPASRVGPDRPVRSGMQGMSRQSATTRPATPIEQPRRSGGMDPMRIDPVGTVDPFK